MATTNIPWCEQVWNPIVGCSKISTGCKNCYAERIAQKLKWTMFQQYENVVDENGWTGELSFSESKLEQPLFLRKPRVIFVNSMGDLFHENMKQEWLDRIFGVMVARPQHTFIALTKRPERIKHNGVSLPNLFMGVSAENQQTADERIPHLLNVPAQKRILSAEPMLEEINITEYLHFLDWVICGPESGHFRRPFNIKWAQRLYEQCKEKNVPFFFKPDDRLPQEYPYGYRCQI